MAMRVLDSRERKIISGQFTMGTGEQLYIPNARSDRRYEIDVSTNGHAGANMEVYLYFDGVAGTAGGRAFHSNGHNTSPTETLTLPAVFLGQIIYGSSNHMTAKVSELRPGNRTKVTADALGDYYYSSFVHVGAWSTLSILFPNACTVDVTVIEKVV